MHALDAFIEPIAVTDIFASGLAFVEDIGSGCFRLTFYVEQRCSQSGEHERVIIARIVMSEPASVACSMETLSLTGAKSPESRPACDPVHCHGARRQ